MAKIPLNVLFSKLGINEATSIEEINEIVARLKKGKDVVKAEMTDKERAIADWLDGSVADEEN